MIPDAKVKDYYLGATAADGTKIAPVDLSYNWLNYDFSVAATYKLTDNFGFTGDFTCIVQHPKFEAFAPATLPNTDKISALAGRGDVVFSDKLNHASIIDGMQLAQGDFFRYKVF